MELKALLDERTVAAKRAELKVSLYELAASCARGAEADNAERTRIELICRELEGISPTSDPLGADSGALLSGRRALAYTTSASILGC